MSLFAFGTGAFRAASRNLQNIQQARADIATKEAAGQEKRDLLEIQNDYAVEAAEELAKTRAKAAGLERDFRAGESALQRANELEKAELIAGGKAIKNKISYLANNEIIGSYENPLVTFQKKTKGSDYTTEIFQRLAGLEEDGFNKIMSDPKAANQVRNLLRTRIARFRDDFGKALKREMIGGVATITERTNPLPTVEFSDVLGSNPALLKEVTRLQQKVYTDFFKLRGEKNLAAIMQKGSRLIAIRNSDNPELVNNVNNATKFFLSQNLNITKDPLLALETKHNISADNPAHAKFFKFGSNKAVIAFMSGTGEADFDTKQKYTNFILDEKNGFFRNGEFTDDFFKAQEIFANRLSSPVDKTANLRVGERIREKTFGAAQDADISLRKRKESIADQANITAAALRTLDELRATVDDAGTGSSALTKLITVVSATPKLIEEVASLGQMFTKARGKTITVRGADGKLREISRFSQDKITYINAQGKEVKGTVEDKVASAFDVFTNKRGNAAARVTALETILAYQLTSILQGGTGGRTISDQDVTRTLQVFSGSFISLDQKKAKLDYLRKVISLAGAKSRLYRQAMKGESNYGMYLTAERHEGILDQAYRGVSGVNINNLADRADEATFEFERKAEWDDLDAKSPDNWGKFIPLRTTTNDKGEQINRPDEMVLNVDRLKKWTRKTSLSGESNIKLVPLFDKDTGAKLLYDKGSFDAVLRAYKQPNSISSNNEYSAGLKRALGAAAKSAYFITENKPITVKMELVKNAEGKMEAELKFIDPITSSAIEPRDLGFYPYDTLIENVQAPAGGKGAGPAVTPIADVSDTREIIKNYNGKPLTYIPRLDGENFKKEFYKAAQNVGIRGYKGKTLPTIVIDAMFLLAGQEVSHSTDQMRLGKRKNGEINAGFWQWTKKSGRLDDYIYFSEQRGKSLNDITNSMDFFIHELVYGEAEGKYKAKYNDLLKTLMNAEKNNLTKLEVATKIDSVYLRSARDTNVNNRNKKASTKLFTSKIKKSLEGSN
tara:strand:- start:341 stop:3385 length:3045 start_codon:yes stop_codon:yes gene_type:complete